MSITRHHNEWLSLVPNSGPFLSLPVLAQAFPQGLDAHDADHARRLRLAFEEWDDNQSGQRPDPGIHRAWIKFVLDETLGYDEVLAEGQAIPQTLKSECRRVRRDAAARLDRQRPGHAGRPGCWSRSIPGRSRSPSPWRRLGGRPRLTPG